MANTLNIPEVTMAQLADATHAINLIVADGTGIGRSEPWTTLVVRVTDHVSNDAAEIGEDTSKMALFTSRKHGDTWVKDSNVIEKRIYKPAIGATPVPTADELKSNVVFVNSVVVK